VRSVLPVPGWRGQRLPPLKPWVRAVFAGYILVTVPLLGYLLGRLVASMPRVMGAAWSAGMQQRNAFATAQRAGDSLGMLMAVVQVLILALSTFGLLLVVCNLGYKVFRTLWQWSQPTRGRRVVGTFVAIGIITLVAFLWAP
jgi:hypothetical protein